MRVRKELVIAAQNFGREENLFPFMIPTMSKDMEKLNKLAHKEVDGANRILFCKSAVVHCGQAKEVICRNPTMCK